MGTTEGCVATLARVSSVVGENKQAWGAGKGPCRRGGRKHRKASETHHCSRGDPVELPARITLP